MSLSFSDPIWPYQRNPEGWPGTFVRLKDSGRIGEIVRLHPDRQLVFVVQLNPLGKKRHRDRLDVKYQDMEVLNPLEVLAEVARA